MYVEFLLIWSLVITIVTDEFGVYSNCKSDGQQKLPAQVKSIFLIKELKVKRNSSFSSSRTGRFNTTDNTLRPWTQT
jgi:hypothetical protein